MKVILWAEHIGEFIEIEDVLKLETMRNKRSVESYDAYAVTLNDGTLGCYRRPYFDLCSVEL